MTDDLENADRPAATTELDTADAATEPITTISTGAEEAVPEDVDPGRSIRTWFWMLLIAGFGLFLVFGSVRAHYWRHDIFGNSYPVRRGVDVLDVWRAQVNGLPDVAHQTVLKVVFLTSVFGFIGLAVIALWLASVVVRPEVTPPPADSGMADGPGAAASHAAG